MSNKLWNQLTTALGLLIAGFGGFYLLLDIPSILKSIISPHKFALTLFFIYSYIAMILILISGIGILKRKPWARILVIVMALERIFYYLYFIKRVLFIHYTKEYAQLLENDTIALGIMKYINESVIHSCLMLSIVFFFLYPKVRRQFRRTIVNPPSPDHSPQS